jgi:hypothetical protein
MKYIGFILLSIGFLAGALVSVINEKTVRWDYFAISMAVGAAGVVIARAGHKKIHTSQTALDKNITSVETALKNIVKNITDLNSQKEKINTYDVRFKINDLFLADLTAFVDARHSISHIFGLAAYGEIMSSFAAGERYLNRVWSASADGYIDEVNTYIEKSREQFTESLDKLHSLKQVQPSYRL